MASATSKLMIKADVSKSTGDLFLSPDRRFLEAGVYDPIGDRIVRRNGVDWKEAGFYGKRLNFIGRKFLLMHYTAGRSFESTVEAFSSPASKASAHLVVGRKGQLAQMVPFNRPAWHAGSDSVYSPNRSKVYRRLNFYSVGIEFDNYGPLRSVGRRFLTWYGREVPEDEVAEVDPQAAGSFGVRFWHAYSEVQIELAEQICGLLVGSFRLEAILGHSDVCPGRKTDPGPLFPMEHIRSRVFGRAD